MDKFLYTFDIPKLNQEDANYLFRFIVSNEIEAIVVSQQRRARDQMDSLPNSTRTLKKN
jgi:hypothetical protein